MRHARIGSHATRVAVVLAIALAVFLVPGAVAYAMDNNNIGTAITIPTPLPVPVLLDGSLDPDFGDWAVYAVDLNAGDSLFAGVTDYYGFYLLIYGPTASDVQMDTPLDWMPSVLGDINYVAPSTGTYYLAVWAPNEGDTPNPQTASLWAGALRKTTNTLSTTYDTPSASNTTGSSSISGVPFNTFAAFEGQLTSDAGGVEFEPVSVLRQFYGAKQQKIATAWTFGDADAGYWSYVPFPIEGVKRKVTYTFQYAGTDPDVDTAEGLGFSTAQVTITPKALLTSPACSSTVYHGRAFGVEGRLAPRHTSGSYPVKLYCYRLEAGKWRLRKTVNARASNTNYTNFNLDLYMEPATKYSASVTLPYAGRWQIKAYHSDGDHYPTWSATKSIYAR